MLLSMTGFGKAVVESATRKITVEVKSLNSKQLDMNVRIPYILREREFAVRAAVGQALERGKIDVTINVEDLPGADVPVNAKLNITALKQYKAQISDAAKELGIPEPDDWYSVLMRFPDAIHSESPDTASEDDAAALDAAVELALAEILRFRGTEGLQLQKFFTERVNGIAALLADIEPFEKDRVAKIRLRLEDGLAKIPNVDYDKGRLEQELIFYIEKLDVNEEKQRLSQHLRYFAEVMEKQDRGQGKKLGFISQEMGREINTLGSKSNDADMQAIVVKMKDLLEQIKEQVLNVM